tara:strand:+ start:24307 stop:25242 length:936 start_codon:yes stop_codon:yes gene_type:complete
MINKNSKIYIAGHNGMVGSACWRLFLDKGYNNLVGKSSADLDLRDQKSVEYFFKKEKPKIIIDAAAKVGGIWANNQFPYDFLMENMLIQNNLIKYALEYNISKFIFLGSSCVYPKNCPQPIKEEYLLTGSLEKTNQWYAIAKISGIKLCESIFTNYNRQFISLMPTNLYGPNDNFELKTSHVLPAIIKKFHNAKINGYKEIDLWGDGTPLREFLYTEDIARAVLFACENKLNKHIYNIGSGDEFSIKELALKIKNIIGFKGNIKWDSSMPNGTPRKLLDSSKINKLGWKKIIDIDKGIKFTYDWFLKNHKD